MSYLIHWKLHFALPLVTGYKTASPFTGYRQTLTVLSTKMKPYGVVSVVSRFRLDRGKLESTCQTYGYRRVRTAPYYRLPRLVPTSIPYCILHRPLEIKWHFFTNTTHSTLLVSSAGM